ncbi:MAG: TonB-dependent receptor [Gemmatimonadaceae bacterium]|nr:TonB-dependent receptor [Gemmatimonadaceae bacterium]
MHRSRSPGASRARTWLLAIAAVLTPTLAQAQGTGMLSGVVTDRASGAPINGARVQVVGEASLGANSDDNGRYFVRGIPTGQRTVRVTRIGFRPEAQTVTIAANDTLKLNFAIAASAVELQQVVVTGTGGAVEKRKMGASIGTMDVAAQQDIMPVTNFTQVLANKVTGVRSVGVGGGVGGGQDLRIRGVSSFSLNQRPVIYIDGVRVDSRGTEWTTATGMAATACCSFSGGNSADRLSDLNPNDIERVEVLKGAAAATLYGSEATNGVIQVFTKKGRGEGRTQWNLGLGTGYNRLRENLPTKTFPRFTGPDGTRAKDANGLIENGPFSSFDVSGQGGTTRSTYFVSALGSKEVGSIQPNDQVKGNLRANVTFVPTDKWTVEVRSAYTRNVINELQAGNNWTALLGNAMNGNPRTASATRPYGEAWVPVKDIQSMETKSDADRWTGGVTLSYAFNPNFTHRFIFGTDAVNEQKSRFFPYAGLFGPAGVTNGQRNIGLRNYRTTTVDYLGTLNYKLPFNVESNLSFGGQGFWESQRLNIAVGNNFPGPGVSTVAAAALTSGGEAFTEIINLGLLAQNRFAWNDRLFVTLGLRMDGNSAFGADYGFQKYPKADVSYDLSKHEGLLPNVFSAFRVRGAIGKAGKMPGPFDSFQSYGSQPVYESVPGIVPLNPGNVNLRPELTTEREFGFELGLWQDRVGIEASQYYSKTEDAIVPKFFAPSQGFNQAQRVNIGAMENRGWEASIKYLVISRAKFDWTTGINADGNKNKVLDLGGVTLAGNAVRVGYPVQGVWGQKPNGYSVVTTGANCGGLAPVNSYGCPTTTRTTAQEYFGPPLPTFNGSWSNTIRYKSLSLYGLLSMERGAWFNNGDRPYRIRQGGSDEYLGALGPNGVRTFKSDSIFQWSSILTHFDKRDNVRIRELSLTWQVPERLSTMLKTGRTSVSLAGQNLMWWDDCNCVDPNMNWAGADSFTIGSGFLAQPSPRQYRLQIRTRF